MHKMDDHKEIKLLRKIGLSVSIDKDALRLLKYMASVDRRTISGEVNAILYEAAVSRGLKLGARLPALPPELPPEEQS